MLRHAGLFLATVVVCLSLVSTTGFAQAPPNADTFATHLNPTHNYGSSPTLAVQVQTNAYLRFNLSPVPTGATVTKATVAPLRRWLCHTRKGGRVSVECGVEGR